MAMKDLKEIKVLPSVVLKELNLIKSHRMTLALILIYPLLVIGALGLAFGGGIGMQKVDIALFIPAEVELGPFASEDLVKIIEDTNKVNIQRAEDTEHVYELVKKGESDFGIVVKSKKTADGQIITDLVLDNSNFVVSGMFSPLAKAAIQMTSFEVSSIIIRELWNKLLPVKNDLQSELGKIDEYLDDMETAGQKIDSLQSTMAKIDISALEETLDSQGSNIEATKEVLLQFNKDYQSFKADLASARTSLNRARGKLESYHSKVSEQIVFLEALEQSLQNLADSGGTPTATALEILQLKDQVSQTTNELRTVKSDIEESQRMLNAMEQKIDSAEFRLDSEKEQIGSMNSVLEKTTDDLELMNEQLGSLTATVEEVNNLIDEATIAKEAVSQKMRDSKVLLNDFMGTLGELSQVSPRFLSHPILAYEKNLYQGLTPLGFITPISLGLVLLLTCLLLTSVSVITEKKEGVHLRMKLSSTSPIMLVLGKIIGQMIFAFLASFIILFIGFFVFNAQLQANIPELIAVIAITSFSFISFGMFITNFAKTQSTAILGSLILILPMIFLSGSILPLQLMNPALQGFSALLPLTAANNLLFAVLLRGLPLAGLADQILILLVPAIVLTAYTIKKF